MSNNWSIWSEKLLARAKHLGYKGVLKGKKEVPKDKDAINAMTDAKQVQDMGEMTYKNLLMEKQRLAELHFRLLEVQSQRITKMGMQSRHGNVCVIKLTQKAHH